MRLAAGEGQAREQLRACAAGALAQQPADAEAGRERRHTADGFEHIERTARVEGDRCWQLKMAMRSPFLRSLHTDPRWRTWTESAQRQVKVPASQRTG